MKIELRHGRDRCAKTTPLHHVAHSFDHVGIFVHDAIVAQHLRIGCERATRHWTPGDHGFNRRGFWCQKVIRDAFLKYFLGVTDFFYIDIQVVVCAAKSVPHDQDIGLACAPGTRRQRQVNGIGSSFQRGQIGLHADPGCFMGVKVDKCAVGQQLACPFNGLIHF